MSDLNCPLCGLSVSAAAREGAHAIEHCPRCLAQSGGSVSVTLVEQSAASQSASRPLRALGRLLPTGARQ